MKTLFVIMIFPLYLQNIFVTKGSFFHVEEYYLSIRYKKKFYTRKLLLKSIYPQKTVYR